MSATRPMFGGDLTFMDSPRLDIFSLDNQLTTQPKAPFVGVVGIPFDCATSNRPGTRLGPRAIRSASKMISWERLFTYGQEMGEPVYGNSDNFNNSKVYDLSDITFDYGKPATIVEEIDNYYKRLFKSGGSPLTLGGDHFVSYPVIKTLVESLRVGGQLSGNEPIALVQFDAHSDTWKDEPGRIDHGTGFFHTIKEGLIDPKHSIQVGIRSHNDDFMGVKVIDSFMVDELPADEVVRQIKERVAGRLVYLTIDIDVLDPAFAPGTGTPTMGGMTSLKLLQILTRLEGISLVGCDLVEVSPPYDQGEITALAGATIAAYQGQLLYHAAKSTL